MGDLRRISYAVRIEIGKILFTEVHRAEQRYFETGSDFFRQVQFDSRTCKRREDCWCDTYLYKNMETW